MKLPQIVRLSSGGMFMFTCGFAVVTCATPLLAQAEVRVQATGKPGPYTVERWKKDWPGCEWEDGVKEGHASVVAGGTGVQGKGGAAAGNENRLRVTFAVGEIGPEKGGVGWRWPIGTHQSAELRYTVRFSKDFDWVKGGKLPGLCGGPENVSGGRPATGKNGFSARLMWRKDGRGEAYVYHVNANQRGDYGDSFAFPEDFRFPEEQDVHVRIAVSMNTAGQRDGSVRVWIALGKGKERLMVERTDIEWRTVDTFGVDSLYFETFHGGSDKTWAPTRECWAEFGGISIATSQ